MTEGNNHPEQENSKPRRRIPWAFLLVLAAVLGLFRFVFLGWLGNAMRYGHNARSMGEVRTIAVALNNYAKDHETFPNVKSGLATDMAPFLEPDYLQKIPTEDGYGNPYEYLVFLNKEGNQTFQVVSRGRGGNPDYAQGPVPFPEEGGFTTSCYENDIVWQGETFLKRPDGPYKACGPPTILEFITGLP